jgi:hypothetical protein
MFQFRKMVAFCSLLLASAVLLTGLAEAEGAWQSVPIVGLAAALTAIAVGTLRQRSWSRWLGLGVSIASLPLALVLSLGTHGSAAVDPVAGHLVAGHGLSTGIASLRVGAASFGALALLVVTALSGRGMQREFEGRAGAVMDARSLRLLGYAFTLNSACLGGLVLLAGATHAFHGPEALGTGRGLAYVLTGLMLATSLTLLATRKSAGLLVLSLATLPMLAIGARLALRSAEMGSSWGLVFVVACFVPALASAALCIRRFMRPMLEMLRNSGSAARS